MGLKKKVGQTSMEVHNVEPNDSFRDLMTIILPKPDFKKGKFLNRALEVRRTIREISDKKLPLQMLSNLLWSACGINRKKGPFGIPGRTSATASNSQEIDLFVAMQEGIFYYDPYRHMLITIISGDFRSLAIGKGQELFGSTAPVRLIFVADVNKLSNTKGYQEPGLKDPEVQKSYYFVDTGLIAANVYLYAASEGLAAWFHNCNKPGLTAKLNLNSDQHVLFGQTVGYPVKRSGSSTES